MGERFVRLVALVMSAVMAAGPAAMAQDLPVVGAQDEEPARLEGLIVVGGEAPVPNVGDGAPNFSPEQIAGVICKSMDDKRSNAVLYALERAHQATVRARQARRDFVRGKASEGELRSTELQRQREMAGAMQRQPVSQLPPSHKDGLAIENIRQERVLENGRQVVLVSGVVRNSTAARLYVPPVSIYALDAQDFALASQTNALDTEILEAGQSRPFSLRLRNPPAYTARIHAAFAPPFQLRAFRGCGFFDPRLFDAAELQVDRIRTVAGPQLGRPDGKGAPPYMAAELAALGRITYADAIDAYFSTVRRRQAGQPELESCSPMQDWRKLMGLVELIEEAWIATNAAEEVRRDAARGIFLPQEVAQAEEARAKAINAFLAARPVSRGLGTANIDLDLLKTEVRPRGANDEKVVVSGAIRNVGEKPVASPQVLLTVKDAFGYVVTERLLPTPMTVAPLTQRNFSFEIELPPALTKDVTMQLAC